MLMMWTFSSVGKVDHSEQEEEDPLYIQGWQVIRQHEAFAEPRGEQ